MTWRRRCALRLTCLLGVVLAAGVAVAEEPQEPTGAEWELRALGVPVGQRLDAVRAVADGRPVVLAIVGQGGVSEAMLEPSIGKHTALEYRDGATDPGTNTHDTAAARVILNLTSRLGLQMRLLVYQPGEPFRDVADAMEKAGAEADIVVFFQSFWGPDVMRITDSIRHAKGCLFISPYVEYRSLPTSTCPQAHSAKPWADGLPHFVTASPMARKAPGRILQPASGEEDTEVINFLAPSYYASGPGGTCPAAEVTAAVAAYVVAASPSKPSPGEIVTTMRETVTVKAAVLAERLGYDASMAAELVDQITALASPGGGAPEARCGGRPGPVGHPPAPRLRSIMRQDGTQVLWSG